MRSAVGWPVIGDSSGRSERTRAGRLYSAIVAPPRLTNDMSADDRASMPDRTDLAPGNPSLQFLWIDIGLTCPPNEPLRHPLGHVIGPRRAGEQLMSFGKGNTRFSWSLDLH